MTTKNIFKLHHKDARNIDEIIKEKIIDITITSPPYFNMKDYGYNEQIGFGQSYTEYLDDLEGVFKKIYDLTKDTGCLWVVIDTFKNNGEVVSLPFDFSNRIKKVGWKLHDIIIWNKDKTVPWSHKGQTKNKFEYVLFFIKNKNYKYYKDEAREYNTKFLKKWWIRYPERYNPKGKAPDEIWNYDIPTQGSWGKKYIRHFCPLPTDMIGRMIQLTSDEGDVILDPFAGSGSVLAQAAYMNRKFIGFELNESYIDMFQNYLQCTFESGQNKYNLIKSGKYTQDNFSETILNLRALKFAKILQKNIKSDFKDMIKTIYVEIADEEPDVKHKIIKVNYGIFFETIKKSESELIEKSLNENIKEIISHPPLSKYGIEAKFRYHYTKRSLSKKHPLYVYNKTTHKYKEIYKLNQNNKTFEIVSPIKLTINEDDFE